MPEEVGGFLAGGFGERAGSVGERSLPHCMGMRGEPDLRSWFGSLFKLRARRQSAAVGREIRGDAADAHAEGGQRDDTTVPMYGAASSV